MKQRLDIHMVHLGLAQSRSQAENVIRMGKVMVDGRIVKKSGTFVQNDSHIQLVQTEQYVSRAGLKLTSVAKALSLNFDDKIVLDVGSSTGGFTDYALQHGAKKVIAIDVGTDQLHPSLRKNPKIELHEKTDIREVAHVDVNTVCFLEDSAFPAVGPQEKTGRQLTRSVSDKKQSVSASYKITLHDNIDIVVIDVSFISLRKVLPHIAQLAPKAQIVAMLKPQFEAGKQQVNKGIIKNEAMRRQILKDFEMWTKNYFIIVDKQDSDISGAKGNRERFYVLSSLAAPLKQ